MKRRGREVFDDQYIKQKMSMDSINFSPPYDLITKAGKPNPE